MKPDWATATSTRKNQNTRKWEQRGAISCTYRALVIVLAFGSLLLASCRSPAQDVAPTFAPPTTTPAPSSTHTVQRGSVEETFEARGRVEGKQEALLKFPLAGTLKDVYVSAGDEVDEGDLLAELDAPEARKEARAAQFDLKVAQADLEIKKMQLSSHSADPTTESADMASISTGDEGPYTLTVPLLNDVAPEIALARLDLERAEEALKEAAIEWDKAQDRPWEPPEVQESYADALRAAKRNYQAARLGLRQAQQTVRERRQEARQTREMLELEIEVSRLRVERAHHTKIMASQRLSNTLLTAPFSGLIVSLDKRAGDQVMAYESIGMLADPSELQVVARVLEENIEAVAPGQSATVRLDAYPDRVYTGTVLAIASEPTVWQDRSVYEVTVSLNGGQDVPASIQMGANVVFTGRSKENVLVVPSRAIITIGGQPLVEVVGEEGDVERVQVQTGLSDDSQTEIIAGLQEGQEIRIP
jgi:HlyD family secretion protein